MPIHPSGAVIARTGVGAHGSVSIAAGRRAGARGQGKARARSRQASLPRLSKQPVAPARGDPPLWVPVSRKLQGATSPDALRAGRPRPPAGSCPSGAVPSPASAVARGEERPAISPIAPELAVPATAGRTPRAGPRPP